MRLRDGASSDDDHESLDDERFDDRLDRPWRQIAAENDTEIVNAPQDSRESMLRNADFCTNTRTRPEESYWALSRAPLESMVFTMPLVLFYETGVLVLGRGTPRNGADVWLRTLLDTAGFGSYLLLPVLTVVGLLAWHHLQHERWVFSGRVLVGMAFESLLLACLLIGLARLQEGLWPATGALAPAADVATRMAEMRHFEGWDASFTVLRRLVGFCGAGLYEEVLFRLLLLPVIAWAFTRLGMGLRPAMATGVLVSAVLFSAAHYVGPLGDSFDLYSFTFRAIAGGFFGWLFLLRGFGITAGTHAMYDVLVGLL